MAKSSCVSSNPVRARVGGRKGCSQQLSPGTSNHFESVTAALRDAGIEVVWFHLIFTTSVKVVKI